MQFRSLASVNTRSYAPVTYDEWVRTICLAILVLGDPKTSDPTELEREERTVKNAGDVARGDGVGRRDAVRHFVREEEVSERRERGGDRAGESSPGEGGC